MKDKEPYILLYIMQSDKSVYQYAEKLKKNTGLRVVEISRYGYQPGFVDDTLIDIGPSEFVGLFRDTSFVCTNSFHGFVFSLIFEKEFCSIPCKRFNSRISSLLERFDITIPEKMVNDDKLSVSYDKMYVRDVIEKERRHAVNYLKDCIWT